MVAVLQGIDPAGVYTSGQVCRALGIGVATLSRYKAKGIITPGHRPGSSWDFYSGRDIIRLHRIVY
jgi:DNA-binding transcriptional MerR regulator